MSNSLKLNRNSDGSFTVEWDKNDDVTTFFDGLDKLEEEMADDYGITWPTNLKIITAVEAMYDSGAFTRDEMIEWEDKL